VCAYCIVAEEFYVILHILRSHRIPAQQGLEGASGDPPAQPLPKQGHPEQAAQDRVQAGLEYLQRRPTGSGWTFGNSQECFCALTL